MQRFKSIVVSVDASQGLGEATPHSVTRALRIGHDTGAEVRIVGTVDELPPFLRRLLDASDAELTAEYDRNLRALIDSIRNVGPTVSHVLKQGRPFLELIREVERTNANLLIRDISEDRDAQEAFFSGLDMRLVRNCPCPVWMVKRDPSGFEHVLAAVDLLSERDDVKRTNCEILDVAQSVAQSENGVLHVIGAVEGLGKHGEPILNRLRPGDAETYLNGLQDVAANNLRELLRGAIPRPTRENVRVEVGHPPEVIRNYAREIDADVIVMGTVNRTTVPSMLVGNTAEQVLHTVRSSVLCVKPADFRSPLS